MTAAPKKSHLRRWLRRGLIGCAVLVVAMVAAGWALWHNDSQVQVTISEETTWIVEPLRDDGYVDYVAALNQHASEGVTPENNAAVLFFRALGPKGIAPATSATFYQLLGIEPLDAEGDYFVNEYDFLDEKTAEATDEEQDRLDEEFERVGQRPWPREDCPLLADLLAANEKPLLLVVEGTRRPHCYWPLVGSEEDTTLLGVLVPGVQGCREFTRALCARAMLHAGSGRMDEAWADLMACHRLARLTSRGPSLVDALVAAANERMACKADAALARHGDLSVEQARQFAAELAKLPPLEGIADKLDVGERYTYLDNVCMVAREEPKGIERLSSDGGAEEESVGNTVQRILMNQNFDWDHILKMAHPFYDDMAAAARKPTYAERREAADEVMARTDLVLSKTQNQGSLVKRLFSGPDSDAMGYIFISLMAPAVAAVNDAVEKTTTRLEMTRMAFALAAYRADNGSYPATLADLAPKYLAKVPTDVFSDGDFQYETTDDGYRLWSIGPDGVDDGGEGPHIEDYEGDGDDLLIATGR